MPLSGEAVNEQLNMLREKKASAINVAAVSIGKLEGSEQTLESEATTTAKEFTKASHGFATKSIVVITELNGKTTVGEAVGNLVVGVPYWAREVSSSKFSLAYTKAQCESASSSEWIEVTEANIKTTTKFAKVVEATVKERLTCAPGAAANLLSEDSTAREIESTAASQKIKWILYYSATSGGTFMGLHKPAEEKEVGSGDLYKVTKTQLFGNAYLI